MSIPNVNGVNPGPVSTITQNVTAALIPRNVNSYILVPSGDISGTTDSANLQAAIDAGYTIYPNPGIYYIANVTLNQGFSIIAPAYRINLPSGVGNTFANSYGVNYDIDFLGEPTGGVIFQDPTFISLNNYTSGSGQSCFIGNNQNLGNWGDSVSFTSTSTSPATLSATSNGTLSGNWYGPTGTYRCLFNNDANDIRTVTFTNGSNQATWTGGLSSAATGCIVNYGIAQPPIGQFQIRNVVFNGYKNAFNCGGINQMGIGNFELHNPYFCNTSGAALYGFNWQRFKLFQPQFYSCFGAMQITMAHQKDQPGTSQIFNLMYQDNKWSAQKNTNADGSVGADGTFGVRLWTMETGGGEGFLHSIAFYGSTMFIMESARGVETACPVVQVQGGSGVSGISNVGGAGNTLVTNSRFESLLIEVFPKGGTSSNANGNSPTIYQQGSATRMKILNSTNKTSTASANIGEYVFGQASDQSYLMNMDTATILRNFTGGVNQLQGFRKAQVAPEITSFGVPQSNLGQVTFDASTYTVNLAALALTPVNTTSATLSAAWRGVTGTYSLTFNNTNSETRPCTLTNGATTCIWTTALSGTTGMTQGQLTDTRCLLTGAAIKFTNPGGGGAAPTGLAFNTAYYLVPWNDGTGITYSDGATANTTIGCNPTVIGSTIKFRLASSLNNALLSVNNAIVGSNNAGPALQTFSTNGTVGTGIVASIVAVSNEFLGSWIQTDAVGTAAQPWYSAGSAYMINGSFNQALQRQTNINNSSNAVNAAPTLTLFNSLVKSYNNFAAPIITTNITSGTTQGINQIQYQNVGGIFRYTGSLASAAVTLPAIAQGLGDGGSANAMDNGQQITIVNAMTAVTLTIFVDGGASETVESAVGSGTFGSSCTTLVATSLTFRWSYTDNKWYQV